MEFTSDDENQLVGTADMHQGSTHMKILQRLGLAALVFACCGAAANLLSKGHEATQISSNPDLQSLQVLSDDKEVANEELSTELQHIWIVRHGDKFSSYPDCPEGEPLCYNETLMGDNPPLTPCGVKQAAATAKWFKTTAATYGGIKNIVVSPYTRTLQTSLPLAKALDVKLKVEYLLSEANQPQGPFQPSNVNADEVTKEQLKEVADRWDLNYGSPPILTPETPVEMYNARVEQCADTLRKRFPPSSGNLAVYTHATTAFSVAFGLCKRGTNGASYKLKDFVEKQNAIAPAGVIHVVRDCMGDCVQIDQTDNVAESVGCGKTEPFKCEYDDFPAWYWTDPAGAGPNKCA